MRGTKRMRRSGERERERVSVRATKRVRKRGEREKGTKREGE